MTEEQWKPIKNAPNYLISSFGRVRSIRNGVERDLKLSTDKDGYNTIIIKTITRRKLVKVHRLVAQAFIDNPDNKPQVCHKDGVKKNNIPNNLYWGTSKENNADKIKHGTVARGEMIGKSVLTQDKVLQIKLLLSEGRGSNEIGRMLGIHKSTIKSIKYGDTWSWLTQHTKEKP